MKHTCSTILTLLALLTSISATFGGTAGPWLGTPSIRASAPNSFSPPFNETVPIPVPLTISLGYPLAPSGSQPAIVLCVEFTNVNHTKTKNEIQDVVFSRVSHYYQENSYNKISLAGDVSRWYQMNKTVGAYGRDGLSIDDPNGDGSPDSWILIQEAIDAADSEIDFSKYSYVMVLHAGSGQETSGNPNDLWSCAYLMGVWFRTRDGISFSKAMIVPETESQGADIVGVISHEFAHLLGLPDLYDPYRRTDYVGRWELMGKGLWNGNPPGSSPSHMFAWAKIRLGWISESQVTVLPSGIISNVTLNPIEQNGTTLALKIPITERTYYLAELRQRIGYDIGLPDTGLLVTYVDISIPGPGGVRIVDANPLTATLDDCLFKPGRTFTDTANKISLSISGTTGENYRIQINRVGPAPDLAIAKLEITPYPPRSGRVLALIFHIRNEGTATASSFAVHVYLDANILYTNIYTLEPGSAQLVQLTWNATFGKHTVRCIVDSARRLSEINRSNNEVTREFIVGSVLSVRLPWIGGSIKVNGTTYASNGTSEIEVPILRGEQTIEAPQEHVISYGTRRLFVRWSDGHTSNLRVLHATGDIYLSAEYKTQYRLIINSGKGTTSGNGWYDKNSTATARATSPSPTNDGKTRFMFSHWSGDQASNSTVLQLLMNQPYNVTANWIVEHYLTILSSAATFAEQGWHKEGTEVQLRASSPIDHGNRTRRVFINWSGDMTSESEETSITMSGPRTIFVNWRTEYELQILSEHGKASGQGWIPADSTARFSIEATVDLGNGVRHVFAGWSGDYEGLSCEASVVMDVPKVITANWRKQYLVNFNVVGLPNGTSVSVGVNSQWRNGTMPYSFSEWVDAGSVIELGASSKLQAGSDQYVLQGWRSFYGQSIDPPLAVNSPTNLELVYVRKPKGLLDILVATYGVDGLPELALLTAARERYVSRSFAGKHWSNIFDEICHSLAPNLATLICENPTLRRALGVLFYPTVRILGLSASAYFAVGPGSEVAFFAAGLIASAMIGVVHFSPLFLLGLYVTRTRRRNIGRNLRKYVGIVLLISAELIIFGEITHAPITTTAGTFILLAVSACLSSAGVALMIYWIAKKIRKGSITSRNDRDSKTLMGLLPKHT